MMMSLQSNHNLPYSGYHQLSVRKNPATTNLRLISSGGYPHPRLTATPPKTLFNVESTHSTSLKFPRVMITSKRPLLLLAATNSDESHPSDEPPLYEIPATTKWLNFVWHKFIIPLVIMAFGFVASLALEFNLGTIVKEIEEMFPHMSLLNMNGCLSRDKWISKLHNTVSLEKVVFPWWSRDKWIGELYTTNKEFPKFSLVQVGQAGNKQFVVCGRLVLENYVFTFFLGIVIYQMVLISISSIEQLTKTKTKTKTKSVPLMPRKVSQELAEFLSEITREEIMKMIRVHIVKNGLRDPKDKKIVLCDEKLKNILGGTDRVAYVKIYGMLCLHF